MTTEIEGVEGLRSLVGSSLGYSQWHTITQDQINAFADATGDHQWIHIDPERAKAGPFGTTIAHGYLTLSLVPMLSAEAFRVSGVAMGVNYGANKIRFPAPVPSGSKVRLEATLVSVEEVSGGVQVATEVVISVEGAAKPSLVAETLARFYI